MLLSNLDILAAAPGGVARLRELILTLAVQGKLVPQNPADEPASVLLEKIRAEKERLMAEGKIKRGKPLAAISEEEKPFEVPVGWEWVRLGEVVNSSEAGWSPTCIGSPRREGHWGVLKVSAVSWGQFDATANKELPADLSPRPEYEVKDGDFLLSRANTETLVARSVVVGKAEPRLMLSDKIIRLDVSSQINRIFLNLCNNARHARSHYIANASGTSSSMKNVSRDVVLKSPVPLPPRAEQSRIVTRVEELMQLCDALEAKGRLEAAQHARLVSTLLATLTDSANANPEALAENWQRVRTHFDLLLDRPEAVDALEQTLLQLAVRGLLVPQDPQDEPASALLARIRTEKDRLIAEGKIKRDKPLAAIAEEEKPFALSSGWEWVPIETLAHVGTGSTPARDNPAYFDGGKIPWATSGETGKFFIHKTAQHVTEIALSQTSLTVYPVGTLIVAMYGQGKTRGQVSELMIEATTNQACAAIVLVEPSAEHRQYVKLVFEKSYKEMRELSAGGAQPNLNVGKIKLTLIPLPPIAEQSRIVARVASLRRLCFELRQRLAASQSTQVQLGEALVASVVG